MNAFTPTLLAVSADAELIRLGMALDEAAARENAEWAACGTVGNGRDDDDRFAHADALADARHAIAKEVAQIAATTFAGVAVKVRAVLGCRMDEPFTLEDFGGSETHPTTDVRLLAGMLNDLARICGTCSHPTERESEISFSPDIHASLLSDLIGKEES